jgi:hypothetical protein
LRPVRLAGSAGDRRRPPSAKFLEQYADIKAMRTFILVASLVLCSASLFAESAAGMRWTTPEGWKSGAPRPMRAATYTITPAPADQGAAECVVNYFGAGQGGSVEANIDRWKSQVQGLGGKPVTAKVAERKVRGLTITTIDASGAYSGMGGPNAASPAGVPGYRLLGAIVEAPGGTVFFKLTGPARTIAANAQKFEQMLASLQLEK